MKPPDFRYCPLCGAALAEPATLGEQRRCVVPGCGFVHWNNPVPVVAVLAIAPDGLVMAHNRQWPANLYAPITGFVEAGEEPLAAARRETIEELGVTPATLELLGVYGFAAQNQLIIAYRAEVAGDIVLSEELDAFRIVPLEKLKPWPFGTGLAVRDLLALSGKPGGEGQPLTGPTLGATQQ